MSKTKIIKWLRIIHRDLGFLMVGVAIIYGVSGIIVNHIGDTDPAFETIEETVQISTNLTHDEIPAAFEENGLPEIKRIATIDEELSRVMLDGGVGVYNSTTGEIAYELHTRKEIIYWFNRLHYNRVKGWSFMADFFAISLIFFAISGLFLVRGKKGVAGRGKWFLIVGLLIPIIYILFSS